MPRKAVPMRDRLALNYARLMARSAGYPSLAKLAARHGLTERELSHALVTERIRKVTPWIAALRTECARTSKADLARRAGVSRKQISDIVNGKYKGNPRKLKAWVETNLLSGGGAASPLMASSLSSTHADAPSPESSIATQP